jgi:hypothetical protein
MSNVQLTNSAQCRNIPSPLPAAHVPLEKPTPVFHFLGRTKWSDKSVAIVNCNYVSGEVVTTPLNPKRKNRPLSAAHECLFNISIVTPYWKQL